MGGAWNELYWAPELWNGDPSTVQTDLYPAACVVLEALTGVPPFPRANLGDNHRFKLAELPPLVDSAFERTMRLLLDKEPARRPRGAREAREFLLPRAELNAIATDQSIQDSYCFDLPKDANHKLLVSQVFEVLPADGEPMTATFNGFTISGAKHIGMSALPVPLGEVLLWGW